MLTDAMVQPRPRLYTLPASHPCAAVEAALALKAISHDRVLLLPLTQVLVGPLLYGGSTVPGMRLDGERLVGSRTIMRRLDSLVAEPSLLPAPEDPSRGRVLEAERWGDETFQGVPRRLIDVAFLRVPTAMESYAGDDRLPLPVPLLRPTTPVVARLMAIRNDARDETARADLAALPDQLAQIDAWIAEGLLGGESPNAADLQIGSTIRLLASIGDVRPLIEAHPAAQLTRYFPAMVGEIEPGVLPAEWLPTAVAS
jgi:glutathione S-transferase